MAGDKSSGGPKAVTTASQDGAATPTLYSHSFFGAELKEARTLLLRTLLLPLLYVSLSMWACLSLVWGSTVSSSLGRLTVHVVNLNHEGFGAQISAGIKSTLAESGNHLDWVFGSEADSDGASRATVINEETWAVVQVNPDVLSSLDAALRTTSPYDPSAAITIYYESARNQITSNSKVLPAILAVLNPVLAQLGSKYTLEFLKTNSKNQSTILRSLSCQSCLASPFGVRQVDLIQYNVPTASAPTMVGMIFLLTYAFSLFQIILVNGNTIGAKLKVRDAIFFRIIVSLGSYFIISLWYTLINLAFGVPMNRRFGNGGFVAYWMLNMCTMASLGMPMESLFTLIGQKWAAYFLSFWIVVNVAGSFQSFELMPLFYSYGYAFPFFNSIQGARTIIFGTRNHLGQNFGILIAWMVAGMVGIATFTAWKLSKNVKRGQHSI